MILMWKFPAGINIDEVRQLRGEEGSYLNPVEDANGNWVVSDEEYCAQEFQYLKREFPHIWATMERIPYEPKPTPPIDFKESEVVE